VVHLQGLSLAESIGKGRDVRDLAQVGDLTTFVRFLRSAAARTAQLLDMTDMARDVGVAPNTARHWLSILAASGLVWLLEPYHTNLSKRLVKTPKLYFLDTGLAAYLTEWSSPATLEAGAMSGAPRRDQEDRPAGARCRAASRRA